MKSAKISRILSLLPKALLLLLLLASCGKSKTPASQKENPVETMFVQAKNRAVSFIYVAQTQSSHLVNIQARVNGFLDHQIYVEGTMVKRNDVLFIMDKKPFQAQVAAAYAAVEGYRAAHQTAKLNLDRVKPLAELKALSQKDLDDAIGSFETTLAQVAQAQAQLETALLNLSYCTIRSPIDGITSAAIQQEGSYLNVADSQLTTVSALDPIWVNFSLSENQLQEYRNEIAAKQLLPPKDQEYSVKVILIDGSFFPYTGKITFTEPYYNPKTGTFLIRVTIANPKGILRPNQYVRVQVEGAQRPNAILVPQTAVHQAAKGKYVWVIGKDNTVEQRPVVVGDWQGENWFINTGLVQGEQIVVNGSMSLSAGAGVTITKVVDPV